tara:strand:+ start:9277 stop:10122 length:846 start_codon:yes stop_codon:yes gene_type:complete
MNENPLTKYFRKPAIYVSLPTKGRFNPEIDQTIIDEIGVMPMTAIDEITLRNPDSLLNGEAMISLFKSCCPSIPNPRNLCNIDAEALFLAISYATYGKEVTHTHKCTKCDNQSDFNIDINFLLNKFPDIDVVEPIMYEDLEIHVKPPSLESVTRVALIQLEEQRIVNNIKTQSKDDADELELAKRFYSSFERVARQNVDLLSETVSMIRTKEADITDRVQINEFLANIPASLVTNINKSVEKITRKPAELNKFNFVCPVEDCGHKETISLEMNPINFSVAG